MGTKIAFVSGAIDPPWSKPNERLQRSFSGKWLSYNEGLVFESEYKFKAGINLAERVRNSGATAAFVTDDELAIGLLDGMLDAGVKVPEEFEIITSNSLLTEVSRPRLSSITQPLYDIGAVSMRLLTKLMNKEEIEEKQLFYLMELIKRFNKIRILLECKSTRRNHFHDFFLYCILLLIHSKIEN